MGWNSVNGRVVAPKGILPWAEFFRPVYPRALWGLGIAGDYVRTAARKGAVTDFLFWATSSGVPWAMIWPPWGPASGPRSMR